MKTGNVEHAQWDQLTANLLEKLPIECSSENDQKDTERLVDVVELGTEKQQKK